MNTSESSLTAPADRNLENKWRPDVHREQLSRDETTEAMKELYVTSFTDKFKRSEAVYCDPAVSLQNYGLISFVPAKGATPDKDGIFGMAKVRGCYATEMEAKNRAEELICKYDSYNVIQTFYVGRPFPFTNSRDYAAEHDEVDIKKSIATAMSSNVKQQRLNEEQEMQEIQRREKALLDDAKKTEEDPIDAYTILRVKKAQVTWTYLESLKKIEDMKKIIKKARDDIEKMDVDYPEFKDQYYKKYMEARSEAHIDKSTDSKQDSFLKFLVEDIDLGF